jgi:hypothetical protein
MGKEDWVFLAEEISIDFPYVSEEEAIIIVNKGIKGLLDDEFNRGYLNFTRIYQWFVKEAGGRRTEEEKDRMKFPSEYSDDKSDEA